MITEPAGGREGGREGGGRGEGGREEGGSERTAKWAIMYTTTKRKRSLVYSTSHKHICICVDKCYYTCTIYTCTMS